MLVLLSPAKSLDYDTPAPRPASGVAPFLGETAELIAVMRGYGSEDIARLMDVSDAIAALNVGRFHAWSLQHTPANSKPAVFAFNGDVYEGLDAPTLSEADIDWAQEHVLTLSGLYGVLRPLDALQPYRLEMGTVLPTVHGRNLYHFWGDKLANHLNARLAKQGAEQGQGVIVNLASLEYFKAVDRPALQARVIDCVFEDFKGGKFKIVSFFAKRARGLMARYIVQSRIASVEGLRGFQAEGYRLDPLVSEPDRLVFRRRVEA
jgi:cytoplasmic iron level regulating protein YaaA (DUF328/UPF0246 family)